MNSNLENLAGVRAFSSDLLLKWNTSFDEVKKTLQERDARCFQEQGFRLLRFEETWQPGVPIDLQYQLHFSPDYEYGLRDADAIVEVVGLKIDAAGSARRRVDAYAKMLEHFRGQYGEPDVNRGATPEELERLVHDLDHTRKAVSVMASWSGPSTFLLHELVVTHTMVQRLRMSPIAEDLVLLNRTGRAGVTIKVAFDGGSASEQLKAGAERIVEIPPTSGAEITVRLGDQEIKESLPAHRGSRKVEINRRWLSGKLSLRVLEG